MEIKNNLEPHDKEKNNYILLEKFLLYVKLYYINKTKLQYF